MSQSAQGARPHDSPDAPPPPSPAHNGRQAGPSSVAGAPALGQTAQGFGAAHPLAEAGSLPPASEPRGLSAAPESAASSSFAAAEGEGVSEGSSRRRLPVGGAASRCSGRPACAHLVVSARCDERLQLGLVTHEDLQHLPHRRLGLCHGQREVSVTPGWAVCLQVGAPSKSPNVLGGGIPPGAAISNSDRRGRRSAQRFSSHWVGWGNKRRTS